MFQYRSVLAQIRRGASDRELARSHAMGRRKLAQFRALAAVQGWLDAEAPQDAAGPDCTLPMPEAASRTVLVIEDEEPIREALGALLREWGHRVVLAASAREALMAQRTQALPPDLIVSDLHLGEGPDGIAAIEALRHHWRCELPAVLVTGDTTHEELRRATESGFQVLVKPVAARRLMQVLRNLSG